MSDNESEDPPTPDKFGAFLRFGDDIAPVFDALTIEQVRRVSLHRGLLEPHFSLVTTPGNRSFTPLHPQP